MGKRKEINEKEFGEKLLNLDSQNLTRIFPTLSRNAINKVRETLSRLNNDTNLKNVWELLWKWEDLNHETERLSFFKVQAFMRHPTAKKQREKILKKGTLEDFIRYSEKHYYISPVDFIRYSDIQDYESYKTGASEFFDPLGKMADSEKWFFDFQYPTPIINKDYAPWVVQASLATKLGHAPGSDIREMFSEKEYLGTYENKKTKGGFTLNNVFDFSNWEDDLLTIAEDRYWGEPVIYLRVPLRTYNTDMKEKINFMIREKMKNLECKSQPVKNCREWVLALMCCDLCDGDIKPKQIRDFSKGILGFSFDVKEKLNQGRKLIKNSLTKNNFPY